MGRSTGHGRVFIRRRSGHAHYDGGRANLPGQVKAGRLAMRTKPFRQRHLLHLLMLGYSIVWGLAAVNPFKRNDWFVENLLVFICVPILVFIYRRLPLSDISYVLIFVFLVLHTAGA